MIFFAVLLSNARHLKVMNRKARRSYCARRLVLKLSYAKVLNTPKISNDLQRAQQNEITQRKTVVRSIFCNKKETSTILLCP